MARYFDQDSDCFDPKVVEKARKEFESNHNSRRPDGSHGLQCHVCGRYQNAYAIGGSCCYYCHSTLRG